MKKFSLEEEIQSYLKESNYLDVIAALYSHATDNEIEASKKIVNDMFNKSIAGIGKKLGTIDIIDQTKKNG